MASLLAGKTALMTGAARRIGRAAALEVVNLLDTRVAGLDLEPGQNEAYLARLARDLPLERHGAPEDVARAVAFLLGSDFITGQVVYVDVGRHLLEAVP